MKKFLILSAISFLLLSNSDCSKKNAAAYRGRLEIKGICMNYTISVLTDGFDTSLIADSWTDDVTGKTYQHVFRLGSPCNFPADINEGDEFDFVIDTTSKQVCAVCEAYYPTPSKSLAIKVIRE